MSRALRIALALLTIGLACLPLRAETVRILSGEHDGFTRLAFVFDVPTDWTFGRVGGAYELRPGRSDVAFDASDVFLRVPMTRLRALDVRDGRLRLSVADGSRAVPFDLRPGVLVIDIRDGAPEDGSPFERPLPPVDGPVQADAPPRRPGPLQIFDPALPRLGRLEVPAPDVFWSVAESRRRAAGQAGRTESGAGVGGTGASDRPGGAASAVEAGPDPAAPLGEAPGADGLAPTPPTGPEFVEIRRSLSGDGSRPSGPNREGEDARIDPASSPRRDAVKAMLLEQIARGAAQGLLDARLPRRNDRSLASAPTPQLSPDTASEISAEPVVPPQINIRAQTSIDRDGFAAVRRALTGAADICSAADRVDPGSWGGDGDASALIAQRRGAVLGEFDRASADALTDLVRGYLHLGFGAEARAALNGFATAVPDEDLLSALAAIVDGDLPPTGSRLRAMAACDGPAALWALLAHAEGEPVQGLDVDAVTAAASALPPHLRRHLGDGVAARLLALGHRDAAMAVRDAVTRAPGGAGQGTDLVSAGLALAADDLPEAEDLLLGVVAADGPEAPAALVAYIDARLDRSLPVPPSLIDMAAALAFERRSTPEGSALARAAVRALAGNGDFDGAFAALDRAKAEQRRPGDVLTATETDLFATLAADGGDDDVITHGFAGIARGVGGELPGDVVTALAGRLLAAGFPDVALSLQRETGTADPALEARALIALDDPRGALRAIAGREGAAVARLRAAALDALGDHAGAAAAWQAAGLPEDRARAIWAAGDWDTYAALSADARAVALARIGGATDIGTGTAEDPAEAQVAAGQPGEEERVLALGRALIESSRDTREALADLRTHLLPMPGPPSDAAP